MKTLMTIAFYAVLLIGTVGMVACTPDTSAPTYNNANGGD